MEITNREIKLLAKFALSILSDFPDISFDGGDVQDIAEINGILEPEIRHAPCSETNCTCAEVCNDDDWKRGVSCYRIPDWIRRAAELPLERKSGTCPVCLGVRVVIGKSGYKENCEICKGSGHV